MEQFVGIVAPWGPNFSKDHWGRERAFPHVVCGNHLGFQVPSSIRIRIEDSRMDCWITYPTRMRNCDHCNAFGHWVTQCQGKLKTIQCGDHIVTSLEKPQEIQSEKTNNEWDYEIFEILVDDFNKIRSPADREGRGIFLPTRDNWL